VQAESAKEGSETPRRLRCAPRQQARRAAAMGQVGVGQLRQAAARWPCSACARAALTTALHCAAVGMDRGPGVVRGSSSDGPSGRRRAAPGSSAMALLCMRASSADDCAALCCSRHGQGPWCRPREQQRRAARWRQGRLRQGRRVRRERTCPAAGSAAESCSMDVRTMGQRGWATGAAERCCHGRARRARPPLPFVWAGARCRAACCEEWRGGSSINTAEPPYACVVRSAASMRPVRLV
jgi:hypothetical protein